MRQSPVVLLLVLCLVRCGEAENAPSAPDTDQAQAGAVTGAAFRFTDAAAASGIDFRHESGASEEKYMPETLGSGVCIFDYDGDGWQDLYFVQSGSVGPPSSAAADAPTNRLYRNRGGAKFGEVTGEAGVPGRGYGMGCTAADIENDGDLDLFVTNFGPNILYRNEADGTFTDITDQAGVGDERWSASAAFGDYDGDGLVDLYVTNYVDFSLDNHIYCGESRPGYRTYCHPNNYNGVPDMLYRNLGKGRFENVTREAGVHDPRGKGLGVVWADFDGDGWLDIYVANDATPNFLFHNQRNGTFAEVAQRAGVALGEDGLPQAGMGVAVADCDGDGHEDIFVTHLSEEANALYRNEGNLLFADHTFLSGLGSSSLLALGFGTSFLDADADGDEDLFVANGHILDNVELFSDTITFEQTPFFFENQGGCRFRDVSSTVGPYFLKKDVGRGTAVGDLDHDGDPDLVINSNNRPAHFLINEGSALRGHRIWLALVGKYGRDALGAWVVVEAGGARQGKRLLGASGYLSQGELALHFGLGDSPAADRITVHWPGGGRGDFGPLEADRYYVLREGETEAVSFAPGEARPR